MKSLVMFVVAMLLSCDASAQMQLQEKEHVQAIVWGVELAAFVSAVVVAVLVWRVSKRDAKRNGRSQRNRKLD
jgi:hypothetical protein